MSKIAFSPNANGNGVFTISSPNSGTNRAIALPDAAGTIPLLAAASNTAITSTPAELNALDGITAVVGELNALDIGSTAVGTAVASKAVILDSNKDYTGIRNLTITGGNLVIGTAGKGVDFAAQTSANSVSGVTTTAELFDHYEEGTWTPTCPTASTDLTSTSGRYTRIGREVFISCSVTVPTTSSGAAFLIAGFPFASIAGAPHAGFYMRYTNHGTYRMFFMTASAQSCEMYSLNGAATVLSAVSTKRFDFSGSYQV